MSKHEELRELIRRDSNRRVKSTREAGWNNAKFIRRPLRPSTWRDRILIYVGVFIASTILTWAGYWYLIAGAVKRRNYDAVELYAEPMQQGDLLIIFLAGGVVGVIMFTVVSIADPYGTVAAERREEKRQKEREEMLAELRKQRFPQGTEHEQAIKRLAELHRQEDQANKPPES